MNLYCLSDLLHTGAPSQVHICKAPCTQQEHLTAIPSSVSDRVHHAQAESSMAASERLSICCCGVNVLGRACAGVLLPNTCPVLTGCQTCTKFMGGGIHGTRTACHDLWRPPLAG